jgi:hypothetical protein
MLALLQKLHARSPEALRALSDGTKALTASLNRGEPESAQRRINRKMKDDVRRLLKAARVSHAAR